MKQYRDFQIVEDDLGFIAVHDNYQAEYHSDGTSKANIGIIRGISEEDCVEQIDDFYRGLDK